MPDLRLNVLRDIRIASPCSMSWDEMTGDEKRRHCGACDLDVHNFAAMTTREIEDLIAHAGGRLCARLFRRADGMILTADCPVGVAALRARARRVATRGVAALGMLLSAGVLWAQGDRRPWERAKLETLQPFKWVQERLAPKQVPMLGKMMMGDVCIPTPPAGVRSN